MNLAPPGHCCEIVHGALEPNGSCSLADWHDWRFKIYVALHDMNEIHNMYYTCILYTYYIYIIYIYICVCVHMHMQVYAYILSL